MRPVFMVKMLLDLKYKMYNFFEFPLAGMDVCRTAVRSDSFLDFVWLYMNVRRGEDRSR